MNRKGFTLVEILLAATLVPFVAMALYSNFSAGTRLWNMLKKNMPAQQADIFFYKASQDFNNALKTTLFSFEGTGTEVSFAAFSDLEPAFGGVDGIARVSYSLDPRKKIVLRESQNVSEVYRSKPGIEQAMLGEANSFHIEYFGQDPFTHGFAWTEEWHRDDGSLPAAVRFAVESDEDGKRVLWTRTFHVPTAS